MALPPLVSFINGVFGLQLCAACFFLSFVYGVFGLEQDSVEPPPRVSCSTGPELLGYSGISDAATIQPLCCAAPAGPPAAPPFAWLYPAPVHMVLPPLTGVHAAVFVCRCLGFDCGGLPMTQLSTLQYEIDREKARMTKNHKHTHTVKTSVFEPCAVWCVECCLSRQQGD